MFLSTVEALIFQQLLRMHYLIHIADVVAAYIERVTAVTTIDR